MPTGEPRISTFNLSAIITYSDATAETISEDFCYRTVNQWQYLSIPIIPEQPTKTVSTITVSVSYGYNANIAKFDNISLVRELVQCYSYDEDGNVVAVNRSNIDELSAVYSGGDLISSSGGAGGLYTYDHDDNHNVTTASQGGVTLNITYDENGNAKQTKLQRSEDGLYMQSSATYIDGGTRLYKIIDNLGSYTIYNYVSNSDLVLLTAVPASNTESTASTVTNYRYDASERVSVVSSNSTPMGAGRIEYTYDGGNLATISRYGKTNELNSGAMQAYSFAYTAYGQMTNVNVGSRELAEYEYDTVTHRLAKMTYGNGSSISYTYDLLDRVKTVSYNNGTSVYQTVEYVYDYRGNVSQTTVTRNLLDARRYYYEYDSIGRLIRATEEKGIANEMWIGQEIVQQYEYTYDSKNRLSEYTYFDGAVKRFKKSIYNDDTGLVSWYYNDSSDVTALGYDELNRISQIQTSRASGTTGFERITYTYQAGATEKQTTSLISEKKYTFGSASDAQLKFQYTYDNLGNITTTEVINEASAVLYSSEYVYDAQNQLVLEYVESNGIEPYTMVYDYDDYGNIYKASKYSGQYTSRAAVYASGSPISVETYNYTDSDWKDLLTSYNGIAITYDEIGNPLTYGNGLHSYTFSWNNGRQLQSANTDGRFVKFAYDGNGMRESKKITSKRFTEEYRYDGSSLVEMTRGGTNTGTSAGRYVFLYDVEGNPYAIEFTASGNTTAVRYYYAVSSQGDVIGIVDASNDLVARYAYDAWGKLLGVFDADGAVITDTNHIAHVNPLRYRSYIYDTETGLYYCSTRYYDPQTRRFINADGYVSTGQGYLGFDMFVYCNNNPINYYDPWGSYSIKTGYYVLVEQGDTLWSIAESLTGNGSNWTKIDYHNDPRNLFTGEIIDVTGLEPFLLAKQKPNFTPRKDPRKGSETRRPTGDRERNIGHPDGEEHNRVPKGNRNGVGNSNFSINTDAVVNGVGIAATGAVVAYGVYRLARIIPSLFPPLWFTLPVNVIAP